MFLIVWYTFLGTNYNGVMILRLLFQWAIRSTNCYQSPWELPVQHKYSTNTSSLVRWTPFHCWQFLAEVFFRLMEVASDAGLEKRSCRWEKRPLCERVTLQCFPFTETPFSIAMSLSDSNYLVYSAKTLHKTW